MGQSVVLNWPGGEHEFALKIGDLRAIQDACNAGPQEVLQRLQVGTWRVDDVITPLRLGLERGGMPKADARDLVNRIADSSGMLVLVHYAALVLASSLIGEEDDPVGEHPGVSQSPENGSSAGSTELAEPLASPPDTLTN